METCRPVFPMGRLGAWKAGISPPPYCPEKLGMMGFGRLSACAPACFPADVPGCSADDPVDADAWALTADSGVTAETPVSAALWRKRLRERGFMRASGC